MAMRNKEQTRPLGQRLVGRTLQNSRDCRKRPSPYGGGRAPNEESAKVFRSPGQMQDVHRVEVREYLDRDEHHLSARKDGAVKTCLQQDIYGHLCQQLQ